MKAQAQTALRVALELRIFEHFDNKTAEISATALAEATGAEELLVGKFSLLCLKR